MRRISYRAALTALVFVGAWFVLGFLFLMSPIPSSLGIGGELFQAWLLVFIVALGIGGVMLTLASINGLFPPVVRAPKRRTTAAVSSSTPRGTTQDASWKRTPTSSAPAPRRDS